MCLGWLHGQVETGSESTWPQDNQEMQVRGQSMHSLGRVGGEQIECHQKAIPRKTFFKKQQNQKKNPKLFLPPVTH